MSQFVVLIRDAITINIRRNEICLSTFLHWSLSIFNIWTMQQIFSFPCGRMETKPIRADTDIESDWINKNDINFLYISFSFTKTTHTIGVFDWCRCRYRQLRSIENFNRISTKHRLWKLRDRAAPPIKSHFIENDWEGLKGDMKLNFMTTLIFAYLHYVAHGTTECRLILKLKNEIIQNNKGYNLDANNQKQQNNANHELYCFYF